MIFDTPKPFKKRRGCFFLKAAVVYDKISLFIGKIQYSFNKYGIYLKSAIL